MNFNKRHPSDEIIERELQGLRNPVESKHGVGDAIRTMQSTPAVKGWRSFKWPIGIGSVAVAAGAVILVGSLTTGKAYASELKDIASAQEHQKTMYQKAYIYQGSKTPQRVMETWIDQNKEAFRQYTGDGVLQVASAADGKRQYRYFSKAMGSLVEPNATIDEDRSEHFGIETITAYLNSEFFQKHSIKKTSGVNLNGRTCDLYNFANGYYRIWVDPVTKLPLQREIYDKGVTLWERDVYEYPPTFTESTFGPMKVKGMEYFDFIAARKQLQGTLEKPGVSQKVGDIVITLKAIVKDQRQVRAIWTTSGVDGWQNRNSSSFDIVGALKAYGSVGDMATFRVPGQQLLNEELVLQDGKAFKLPATIRIAAWEADSANIGQDGKPGKKLVGWATFTVKDVMTTPFNSQLFRTWSYETARAVGVAKSK